MKTRNFSEFIDELKSKAEIVSIVRGYLELNRKGSNYWGCCPFHHEKTPSFTVNENGQFYKCFGCGESGDVILFIQKMERIDFFPAVEFLAQKCGIEVPKFKSEDEELSKQKKEKEILYNLLRDSALFYVNQLHTEQGVEAKEYLAKRRISSDTIKVFGLGFSPDAKKLVSYLTEKGYTKEQIINSGVVDEKNGALYDAENGRLVVPIINSMSQVIAFGGRILVKTDFAKYKNTKETTIFSKRKELFAIQNIKKIKQTEGIEDVIIVEGYMDVIAMYQAGIKNAVASMGTALTPEQIKLISRFCDKVYLCYDGDTAGQKATLKACDILEKSDIETKIICLTDDLDPDDYIKKFGKDGFIIKKKNAVSITEFRIRALAKSFDLDSAEGRSNFAIKASELLLVLSDAVKREAYLPLVNELSNISQDSLKLQLYPNGVLPKKNIAKKEIKNTEVYAKIDPSKNKKYYYSIRFLLYSLFTNQSYAVGLVNIVPYFEDKRHSEIYDVFLQRKRESLKLSLDVLNDISNNTEVNEIINFNAESIFEKEEYFKDVVKQLEKTYVLKEINGLTSAYDKESDVIIKNNMLNEIELLKEKLMKFKK